MELVALTLKFLCFKFDKSKTHRIAACIDEKRCNAFGAGWIRFSQYMAPILMTVFLVSPAQARVLNQLSNESGHFKAAYLYQALAAEIYREMGDEVLAVEQYQQLALSSKDPTIAKRVTTLAAVSGQLKKGLKVAEHWVSLTPEDLEARQYLALLYLRNNKIKLSSAQFYTIHGLIERVAVSPEQVGSQAKIKEPAAPIKKVNVSLGLAFIGSILAAETHREKAYQVFTEYLEQYENKAFLKQQKLIAANLAIKAKNYTAVLFELENLTELDPQNLVDASSMKAKALHKLNRLPEAIDELMAIKDNPVATDSSRLELVRLLVLQKQKKIALPILQKLIVKHEKNNDLLKSLIALQIDQNQLAQAENNILKLRATKSYADDADYLLGEVLQARGYLKKALKYYLKVNKGSFFKNAHHKAIFITRKTQGAEGLSRYFDESQKAAIKPSDKAYWFKLRGDSLFDVKNYSQALVYYDKAIVLSPLETQYYYRRGLLYERVGKIDLAEKDFSQVLRLRSNDADALNALGYMLSVNTNRLIEAKQYISRGLQIKPHDPVIMDSLGFVYFKLGNLIKAEKYLRKAFSLIKNPEVASHLIGVLAKLDKHDEAQRIYHEMYKKYPNNKELHEAKQYLQN